MENFNRKAQAGAVAYFRHCIKNGDVEGALSCFDPEGVYIDRDGKELRGLEQIQVAMENICGLKLNIQGETPHITEINELALWIDRWEMSGNTPDGQAIKMTGHTSCVMKRNEAGNWLWIIDNPFGSAVLSH
ncbi:nuclear transport factor 2 family protein [Chryseobacterium tructae]|uniref:YybH family protein n=1 Tax=Chryseobacterium tructae TaxID=1037380 RepID=A0ABV7XUD9_9FLAO|nr:nuclear transport factor 2 family protein [Chryseobacterium tructae]MDN3692322.1 nuclear transport factor 2 family protein [Chryseobacterium tructae]